jgi:hypothetical protein
MSLMRKWINKKGGIVVFLTSILVTMILASMVFVHASRSIGGASYADAVLELSGRAALSEFDRRLKDEYGIFAFYGYEDMVASNINFYASASFNKTLPEEFIWRIGTITDLFRLELQRLNVNLAEYSLMDASVLEEQIMNYTNYLIAQKGIDFIRNMQKSNVPPTNDSGAAGDGSVQQSRELKNAAEINSLPSRINKVRNANFIDIIRDGVPTVSEIFDAGVANVKINEYILSHFNNETRQDIAKDAFFRNEVEYILYGNLSDRQNLSRFRRDFVLFRAALNASHIAFDYEKMTLVRVLAAPAGPFRAAAEAAIIAAWSLAEAENDARRLMAGQNVAFNKTDDTWALSLDNAIRTREVTDDEGNVVGVTATPRRRSGYISPRSSEGLAYTDYLRTFLFLQRRETKLVRIMDLIQLNFRGSYYEEFLIKDHYTGFSLSAVVSGKKFEYEQKY